jgi:hypothetical protein
MLNASGSRHEGVAGPAPAEPAGGRQICTQRPYIDGVNSVILGASALLKSGGGC